MDCGRADPIAAKEAAKAIVGSYRARDFVDPDTYLIGLIANLAQFPVVVIKLAADPVHGIPRKYKFVPSVAEVADELAALSARIRLAATGARRAIPAQSKNH
ncbi:hypothetical protein [Microvirga alba]|uniref:Uncharacterized protein n=1 Tax=Microvirga alba TaxID=2791025 RepID=A0A931FRM1_9HYPH|nr:hypothetical protein [Microvirga alba]MBF9234698.1 hypothetical protein [Microvirga alba]